LSDKNDDIKDLLNEAETIRQLCNNELTKFECIQIVCIMERDKIFADFFDHFETITDKLIKISSHLQTISFALDNLKL
jgi:hypothetical protein